MTSSTSTRPNRFLNLFAADTRNVSRDPALLFAILLSVILPAAVAFFTPMINAAANEAFGIENLAAYMHLVVFPLPAFLIGWVTGFLLLEDRDDGPLLALDITPMGKSGFFAYRATITAIITAIVTVLCFILLAPNTPILIAATVTLLTAIEAVCVAFILPAIARNKVEGLALTKVVNIGAIVPLLVLVASPLRYLGAFIPSYWVGELLITSNAQYLSTPVKIILAIAIHAVVALWLYRIASRRIG